MQSTPYLDRFERWVTAHRELLEKHGQVSFTPCKPGIASAANLVVTQSEDRDVELLLWESGEAEFNRGPFHSSVLEHVDVTSPEELEELLDRVLDAVSSATP